MCPRAFPAPGVWICLGVLALADLLAMAFAGFRLTGYGMAYIAAVSAGAWGLGYVYSTIRPDARIAALGFGAAYLIPFTFAAALLSYVGTSLALPLLDAQFARADAALGLDWSAVLAFTDAHPRFGAVLRLAYHSSMLQLVAVFVILAAAGQVERLGNFLILFTATGLVTILMSIAFPAAGAFVFHDPPAALRDVVGQAAGIWHLEHFQALRSGAMRTIDPSAIEGLITFPSFHTALAVITSWAFWRTRYLALPSAGLSAIVIASTVPVGGHYFVDVFAGAAIAAACIAGLVWRPWLYRTGTPAGIKAQPAHAHAGTGLTQQVAAS
jgi:membrane-associated phospholipid phosphatase